MKRRYQIPLTILSALILAACAAPPDQVEQATLQTVRHETPGASYLPALPARSAVLSAAAEPPPPATGVPIPIETLTFSGAELALDGSQGMTLLPDGLGQEPGAQGSTLISDPLQAPIPFNAVVPEWIIDLPEGTSFELELRTGTSADSLGDWVHIHPSADWMLPGEPQIVGDMLVVPADESTHTFVQYRLTLAREDTAVSPLLRELRFVFLDSTAGPTVAEMLLQQEALNAALPQEQPLLEGDTLANPKPFLISRDIWCIYPDCDYTDGLQYEPVTHLILHHTVSGTGADGDSAAVVRAIWSFHTYTRGWGDIGYNFLVDTNGLLYEGHLGGDDVVGIHAAGANAGSMALAMIGTYSTTAPPEPMLNSIVDMFSWKAEQRNIDVFDASNTLPNIDWGLPNLMGHRDVYGTTECPGGTAHAMLPLVRDRVAARIGLEAPFIVDELGPDFTKSANTFSTGPLQCGYNAHSWYTTSTTNPANAANWGEWRPQIPENGRYELFAYTPYCNTGRPETAGARYEITHLDGITTVTINQNADVGLWSSLGEYDLRAGSETAVRLSNLTQTDSGVSVWFDALRLRSLEPLPGATLSDPPDGTLFNQREITFTWQIENPDKVKATIFQVGTDAAFANRIVNELWAAPQTETTQTFDQDYRELFWRVVVTSAANNEYPSPTWRFAVDATPPQSGVTDLTWLAFSEDYLVNWSGSDASSAIAGYTIEVRPVTPEEAEWQVWLQDVRVTSARFRPPDLLAEYAFRSRATDAAGNVEPSADVADITTADARVLDQTSVLPIVLRP